MKLLFLFFALALAAPAGDVKNWPGMEFLVGNWVGQGAGGKGEFSFSLELNGKIMVRRNVSELPVGKRHEDLMVISRDGSDVRAEYWDTEGHVIHYRVSTPARNRAVFESEGEGPAYRLTYWLEGSTLKGKFEVGGKTYLEWDSRRTNVKLL